MQCCKFPSRISLCSSQGELLLMRIRGSGASDSPIGHTSHVHNIHLLDSHLSGSTFLSGGKPLNSWLNYETVIVYQKTEISLMYLFIFYQFFA